MLQSREVIIESVFVHTVGNKMNEERIFLSDQELERTDAVDDALKTYFFSAFKGEEIYHFDHDVNLDLNEVYAYVSAIFENPDALGEQSVNIAKQLYHSGSHPNIKSGEVCIAYFRDCFIEGETVDAIGIFKSENKDTYLKVLSKGNNYDMRSEEGINVNKLDKGCLIFNTSPNEGYLVGVVDNTNKGNEARYWTDEFLQVKPRRDVYFNTQNVMSACKNFISDALPEQFEVEKADQIDLLNRSIEYFKKNETFNQTEFEGEVFQDEGVIQSFQEFNQSFANENELELEDNFEISKQAVKQKSRVFKSVLKLDKNFHIYIHGKRDWIERGVDESGRKYYKVYYENEH
ncbi:MAG: nucleoid-associated protein [Bacteroidia bacterium]|nr:nucleoid-associated protein [Bacteroidia bacterium]